MPLHRNSLIHDRGKRHGRYERGKSVEFYTLALACSSLIECYLAHPLKRMPLESDLAYH
jgi:hypothetical protein